jgi:hypothetical protein
VQHTKYRPGDREIYNLLHDRSNTLLDYSSFLREHPEVDAISVPIDVESIYISTKHDTPVTTWAHTPGKDKVTVMYVTNIVPQFMAEKYYAPFKQLANQFPELSVRGSRDKLASSDARSIFTMINEIANGAPLPQVLIIGDDFTFTNYYMSVMHLQFDALIEASGGCYELHSTYEYMYKDSYTNHCYKYLFRILPHDRCLKRMVRKNYYTGNRSLGPSMDFEMGFNGYPSPYRAAIDAIKAEHSDLFKV